MKILFEEDNLLRGLRDKKLKVQDVSLNDIFIAGGLRTIHYANKVGIQIGNKVKVIKDRNHHNSLPYIIPAKDF